MSDSESAKPKTFRFCPWCAARIQAQGRFCANCGEPLKGAPAGPGTRAAVPPPSWKSFAPGLAVLSAYLVVGLLVWVFVLSNHRPTAGGPASAGGGQPGSEASLPANHPPITVPEEVKKRIGELAARAEASPEDPQAWRDLAREQFQTSQIEASYRSAALTSFQRLLDLVPDDLEALRALGNVYYDLQEYGKSIDHYEKYLAREPKDASVRTDMATMYLYKGDPGRAIAEYQTVLAENPDHFQARFNMGIAYSAQGDMEKAKEALTRAKELAANEELRLRVEQVMTQLASERREAPASEEAPAQLTVFQGAVEGVFRGHAVVGQKVGRFVWSSAVQGAVYLNDFPIDAMPDEARKQFLARLRAGINEAKVLHSVDGEVKIDVRDSATGQVIESLTV